MYEEKMATNVNRSVNVYGYDEIYNFMVDNPEFVYNGGDEFWFGTALITVGDYYLNVRISNRICVANVTLNYDDFALRYRARGKDFKLLSRDNEKISDKMYIGIKKI